MTIANIDSISQQQSPPLYSERDDNINNNSFVVIPPVAVIHISDSHEHSPANSIITSEYPPSYSAVFKDSPPNYSATNSTIDPSLIIEPFQQQRWSKIKRIYVCGFLFWPFWIVGSFYIFSSNLDDRSWARKCLFNSIIFSSMFSYVIVTVVKMNSE
ncbi:16661_t:CDS:1 [Acaulospora morrowiae]|uniref:16661_t:CDS:1 n=1 Tax=Acaulospora morrowiae TaxID=94023 RepID=A0A9N9D792_9GLOM|nr:16661_t:CDS:1 [Acaulospora morrowiae]